MGSKAKMFKWSNNITPSQVVQLMRAERDIEKAIKIFDSATAEDGFRHNQTSFGYLISKLVSANKFSWAEDVLERMKMEDCVIEEDILLSVCRGYGRVHRPLDAVRVFHRMKDFGCDPTQKSYITIFAILVEENQLKLAVKFYRYMKEMGIPPSVPSLNVLIKALCRNDNTIEPALKIFREMPNRGLDPDSYTYGTLINGLCRFRRIDEAKELFKEMGQKKDCPPSVITYSSLIHGLCESENVDEANELFEEMKVKGIQPNVFTYSSLIDGFCKNGRSSDAVELFEVMLSNRCRPNMITYSSLINGLCKEQKLLQASELLDRMKIQGLNPDAGLYGKIITGFCEIQKFHQAANFLDEMVLGGVKPTRLTWCIHVKIHNLAVRGLCSVDLNRAYSLYRSMRARGVSVEAETYDSLVKCFCKNRDLQKMFQVIDEMAVDGCFPEKSTWRLVLDRVMDRIAVREAAELCLDEIL